MHKERDLVIRRVLIALDAFIISSVFFLVYFLREKFPVIYKLDIFPAMRVIKKPSMDLYDYLLIYLILIFIWCITLYFNGMYKSVNIKSRIDDSWIIIKSAFFVTIIFGTIVFLLRLKFISRAFFILFMLLTLVFLVLEKISIFYFARQIFKNEYNKIKLLVVGTGKRARRLIDKIKSHPEWRYKIEKMIDIEQCLVIEGGGIDGCEVVSDPEDLRKILHRIPIDQVIFAVPKSELHTIKNYLYICEDEGIDVAVSVDFFHMRISQLHHTDLDGIPLIVFEKRFDKEWQLFIKRIIDIVVSGAGLIILMPLFMIIAVLIKITSPGPVFFKQRRVSLHGRIFIMIKFRSMYKEAEEKLKELMYLNEVEGPIFKIKEDPRITWVGRVLRRTSIDELPQLFNVFMGSMSLVGPRPALPREVMQYESRHRRRLSVRPGITCIWQVCCRGEKDFKKWMNKDLEYVDNWSLWLDFKILVKTIMAVVSERGAY